jgi:hypothetical protein
MSSDFACHAVLSPSSSSSFLPCYYRIEFLAIINVEFSRLYFVIFSLLISECTFLFNRADDKDHVEAQDSNTDDS